jgi:SAM-dependent methyltransferase
MLSQTLSDDEYIRQRVKPRPGDPLYLCLSDLLIAIKALIPTGAARVLDYGCGGSPYRSFFALCQAYHRADLSGEGLDFEFTDDARLPDHIGGSYDCVLSTQVLEHVAESSTYLRESYRALRPGGTLVLSTHGMFEEHGCPHDYWRWTGYGLRRAVEDAGFRVDTIKKITTGPRAMLSLSEPLLWGFRLSGGLRARLIDIAIRAGRRLGPIRVHKTADALFANHRVVDVTEPGHSAYVGLALRAFKGGTVTSVN